MPIYSYRCRKCEHVTEEIQRIDDPPVAKCEECGHPEPEKIIGKTHFQLLGSGWYSKGGY